MRHGLCRLMPWSTPTGTSRTRSELVGSIYLAWGTPHSDLATITQLGIEQGSTLADIERHVELLFDTAPE